jgi:hypothetical protein
MGWVDYMVTAAQHSKGNAKHWFRYLSKCVNKFGKSFTAEDMDALYSSNALTLFQRITLKSAFANESVTRKYVASLNQPADLSMISSIRAKYSGGV